MISLRCHIVESLSEAINKGEFDECLTNITKAIDLELSQNKDAIKYSKIQNPLFWYIRWLWYIKLNQYQKAQNDYSLLQPYIRFKEGQQMWKYIFGLILLPVEQNRKLILNSVDGLADIMNYFEANPHERIAFHKLYFLESGWDYSQKADIWKVLIELSFFKRFKYEDIEEFIPKIKVDLLK